MPMEVKLKGCIIHHTIVPKVTRLISALLTKKFKVHFLSTLYNAALGNALNLYGCIYLKFPLIIPTLIPT